MFKNITYYKSIYKIEQLFDSGKPEFLFIGRSNVGKSSLINALTKKKNLAKTSSTPGKTQSINYFLCDEKYFIVDMPGYGYAKISKELKQYWKRLIEKYFSENRRIAMTFLLVDSRYDIMESDIMMLEYLLHLSLPVTILLTKIDKISLNDIQKRKNAIKKIAPQIEQEIRIISTSSEKAKGLKELTELIRSKLEIG